MYPRITAPSYYLLWKQRCDSIWLTPGFMSLYINYTQDGKKPSTVGPTWTVKCYTCWWCTSRVHYRMPGLFFFLSFWYRYFLHQSWFMAECPYLKYFAASGQSLSSCLVLKQRGKWSRWVRGCWWFVLTELQHNWWHGGCFLRSYSKKIWTQPNCLMATGMMVFFTLPSHMKDEWPRGVLVVTSVLSS